MATVLSVSFKNKETELLEFLKDKDFSYYVKNLIRKDMNEVEPKVINAPIKKRNINFDF